MAESSLRFGTSGLRGLVNELNGRPAYAYTKAFARLLSERGIAGKSDAVYVGRDLRASSPAIAGLTLAALTDAGLVPVDCGAVPTPALAAYAMHSTAAAIMVTGSHIPDDRNGLKFYLPAGEIDKKDEAQIARLHAQLPPDLPFKSVEPRGPADSHALDFYKQRYLDHFSKDALKGLAIGVYQHSSVARDLLVELLTTMGAKVIALGRSKKFVPVDTEALHEEDITLLGKWAGQHRLDAIVSTDGDADRPLIAAENGHFVRGDLVGAITARHLGADCIVTPVTSNSALETGGFFAEVARTKVGSPYVIEGMQAAQDRHCIVGFEANGGVLLGSIPPEGRALAPLPTRDAMLPILCCLGEVGQRGKPLSQIAAEFAFLPAVSGRLTGVSPERSAAFLDRLIRDDAFTSENFSAIEGLSKVDTRDGIRLFSRSGEVVHYRASGNAPELRCYVEAHSVEEAVERLAWGLDLAQRNTGGKSA